MKFPPKALAILDVLYKDQAQTIKKELGPYLKNIQPKKNNHKPANWYKNLIIYTVYPDAIIYDKKLSPLANLKLHIPHIKSLGFNAIYILPFLQSPMIDKGFDVSDYYTIRPDLGSNSDLKKLITAANNAGIHLFMDLILNHVSNQHEWVQKAQQGEAQFRDHFFTTPDKPHFIKKIHSQGAVFAKYKLKNKLIKANIAFPELAGPIPHWQQGPEDYWYYHTFYPHQLDLNWNNSDVFAKMAKIMLFWANSNFSFRLDAIPYVGRSEYKLRDKPSNNKKGQLILLALKLILQAVNPQAVLLAESFEDIKQVVKYFGSNQQPLAELSYNFHLNTNLWLSLVKQDTRFIWKTLQNQRTIPRHAEWLNFLRNHDELSLAHINKKLTIEINDAMLKFGKPFRDGHGISGRTFSLLGSNKKRFLMAYFLLASLPGSITLLYGDEFAYPNIASRNLSKDELKDTRNINRGVIDMKTISTQKNLKISHYFRDMFIKRTDMKDFFSQCPQQHKNKEVFSAFYRLAKTTLIIYINLTHHSKEILIDTDALQIMHSVNAVKILSDQCKLGPYAGVWLLMR